MSFAHRFSIFLHRRTCETESAQLDKAPHKPWPRFLPRWLRSLIWVDSSAKYDAFLSYSWKSDSKIAPLIQSVLQRFLCPWYKLRAKTIFRDLSSLPAGSSLQEELFDRMDRSTHLIVLACPDAAHSGGMEMEAHHWFSRHRDGEVIIVATAGEFETWEEVRDRLLPTAVRSNLASEPLWIKLQPRRPEILADPNNQKLRGKLIEDLKQVLLQLYIPRTWEELTGEEHAQRRRALRMVWTVALVFLSLAVAAIWQWTIAKEQARVAFSRQLAVQAVSYLDRKLDLALLLSVESFRVSDTTEARSSLLSAVNHSTRLKIFLPGHNNTVNTLAYISDTKILASGDSGGKIILWDMSDTRLAKSLGTLSVCKDPLDLNGCPVLSLAYIPDNRILASGDLAGNVILWDISDPRSAKALTTFSAHKYGVRSLAYIPESKILASGGGDGAVALWDISDPRAGKQPNPLRWYSDHPSDVKPLVYIPDRRILAAGIEGRIMLWDISDPRSPKTLGRLPVSKQPVNQHIYRVLGLAYIPDSRILASASEDGMVILWDVSDPRSAKILGEPLPGHQSVVESLAYIPDGKILAAGGIDGKIILWDVSDPLSAKTLGEPPPSHEYVGDSLAYIPDGKILASGGHDGKIILWDISNPRSAKTLGEPLPSHQYIVDSEAYIPDRKILAAGGRDGKIILWDVSNPHSPKVLGKPLPVCKEPIRQDACYVESLAYIPDRKILISAGRDGKIIFWDISDPLSAKGPVDLLPGRQYHFVESLAYIPDRKILASGGADGKIVLWDISDRRSERPLVTLPFSQDPARQRFSQIGKLAYVPNRKILASGSDPGEIILWDISDPRSPKPLKSLHYDVRSLAYISDSKILASGGDDGKIVLWDISDPRSAKQLGEPMSGLGYEYASALAYMPETKILVSEWNDGNVILWDMSWLSWQKRACQIANRDFTEDERQSFLNPYYGENSERDTCKELLKGD